MRLIGTLQNENDARRLSFYLKRKGIETNCDVSFDVNTGHMSYQLWVHDEDKIPEAQLDFEKFLKEPFSAAFDVPITEQKPPVQESEMVEKSIPRPISSPFTTFMIGLCAFVFLFNFFEEYPMVKEGLAQETILITPVQGALLFDLPPAILEIEKVIEKHKIPADQKVETLSPEILKEIRQLEKMPYWHGIYDVVLLKIKGKDPAIAMGPLFKNIREGQIWRLFSPSVLHAELLHILFNMIWVWILCRPIEQRIGVLRLIVLTLAVGIGSNIAQYLMSGPFFIGYSGIVMGLAGFTWMRERKAPWEGYPLNHSTVLFLLIFVGGVFLVQAVSFAMQLFTNIAFSPNIANTAHISGAIIGALLGRLSFFAERIRS